MSFGLGRLGVRFGRMGALGRSGKALRQIATRSFVGGLSVSAQNWMSRTFHVNRGNSPTLQVKWCGWYVNSATYVETNVGADTTITASLEYPAGMFTQIKFGGSSQGIIPNGGELLSDPVTAPPNGAKFYIRRYSVSSTAPVLPGYVNAYVAGGDALAAFGPDLTMSGTVTDGGFAVGAIFPQAILGASTIDCGAIWGDSIGAGIAGSGAVVQAGDATGATGIVAPSLEPNYPYINFSMPGQKADDFLTNASKQLTLAKSSCSWLVSQFGTNNIFSGGQNLATVQARLQSVWALWKNANVTQTTIVPQPSSSSDSWASLSGQTINTSPEAIRVSVNTWLRGVPMGIKKCFDVTTAVESSLNSGKWNCPVAGGGTAAAAQTADGIHPNTAGYLSVKASGVIPSNALS